LVNNKIATKDLMANMPVLAASIYPSTLEAELAKGEGSQCWFIVETTKPLVILMWPEGALSFKWNFVPEWILTFIN